MLTKGLFVCMELNFLRILKNVFLELIKIEEAKVKIHKWLSSNLDGN